MSDAALPLDFFGSVGEEQCFVVLYGSRSGRGKSALAERGSILAPEAGIVNESDQIGSHEAFPRDKGSRRGYIAPRCDGSSSTRELPCPN